MSGTYPQDIFRYCPACGQRGFSPSETAVEPPENLSCSRCGFLFFLNAGASVIALIEKEPGVLLMTRRKKEPAAGTLDLPGGFVDPRETAEEALRREIWEECGLTVTYCFLQEKTYWNEYQYGGLTYYTLDLVFRCTVQDWSQLVVTDREEVDTLLVPVSSLDIQTIGLQSVRKVVGDYVKTISGEPQKSSPEGNRP